MDTDMSIIVVCTVHIALFIVRIVIYSDVF